MSIDKVEITLILKKEEILLASFSEDMAESNPYKQYAIWFQKVVSSQILDPYAACLSTVNQYGNPLQEFYI